MIEIKIKDSLDINNILKLSIKFFKKNYENVELVNNINNDIDYLTFLLNYENVFLFKFLNNKIGIDILNIKTEKENKEELAKLKEFLKDNKDCDNNEGVFISYKFNFDFMIYVIERNKKSYLDDFRKKFFDVLNDFKKLFKFKIDDNIYIVNGIEVEFYKDKCNIVIRYDYEKFLDYSKKISYIPFLELKKLYEKYENIKNDFNNLVKNK